MGYRGIEKRMETTIVYWGYIDRDAGICIGNECLGFRVCVPG